MGDVARQARQQKQNEDAQSKAAPASKTAKVITNDETPDPRMPRTGPPPRMTTGMPRHPRHPLPQEQNSRPSSGNLRSWHKRMW